MLARCAAAALRGRAASAAARQLGLAGAGSGRGTAATPGSGGGEQPPAAAAAPLASTQQQQQMDDHMDFPGGSVPFTQLLSFRGGAFTPRAPMACYRTLDASGREVPGAAVPHPLSQETAVRMYETMVKLQTVDTIFYEAQRQVGAATLLGAGSLPAGCCAAGARLASLLAGCRLGWCFVAAYRLGAMTPS